MTRLVVYRIHFEGFVVSAEGLEEFSKVLPINLYNHHNSYNKPLISSCELAQLLTENVSILVKPTVNVTQDLVGDLPREKMGSLNVTV